MQRFIASILLLLYSTANFGLSVRLDYCGDALSDFSLFSNEAGISDCCAEMGTEEDCCNSEQVYFQESSDKLPLVVSSSIVNFDGLLNNDLSFVAGLVPAQYYPAFAVESKAPPLKQRSQVRFSCFLI